MRNIDDTMLEFMRIYRDILNVTKIFTMPNDNDLKTEDNIVITYGPDEVTESTISDNEKIKAKQGKLLKLEQKQF